MKYKNIQKFELKKVSTLSNKSLVSSLVYYSFLTNSRKFGFYSTSFCSEDCVRGDLVALTRSAVAVYFSEGGETYTILGWILLTGVTMFPELQIEGLLLLDLCLASLLKVRNSSDWRIVSSLIILSGSA